MNPSSLETSVSKPYSISVDRMSAAQWHALIERFDDASICQSWSYGSVHWSAGQLSHLTLERDGKIVAAVQVRLVRVPLVKTGIAYVRSGPMCRPAGMPYDPEIARRMIAALKDEYVVRRGLLLRLLPPVFETDPFAASYQSALTAAGFEQRTDTRRYRTVRVDLSPSIEQLRKKLGAKWRNKLNGAEKNGLTVTQGASVEHYAKFLAAYREMMARKNFETTVDVEEFARIQSDLPEALRMQVFLSEKDGTVMNALVVSAMGDTAVYLLGATSDEGLKLKGAYLLQWRAIQWLKERNCRWYELGGIDPVQNPGVYEFKSGFGGEEVHDLGVFEASGSWASRFCVKAAEHARSLTEKLRSWNRRPATVPKG